MAYSRFSETSDIYLYLHYMGVIHCCGCLLDDKDFTGETYDAVIKHLEKHKAAGHKFDYKLIQYFKDEQIKANELDINNPFEYYLKESD
jgi:hypothetical protein